MHGFTKALALEVARKGVTVNTISPGYIGTKMVMAIPKEVLDTKILPQIPLGRLGGPDLALRELRPLLRASGRFSLVDITPIASEAQASNLQALRWLRYPVGSTHRGRTRDHRHRAEGIESPGTPGAFFVSLCIVGVFGWRLRFVGAVFRRGALPTIL
jgi:Enoyl-(Acyl carrier protein) reductase